MNNIFYCFFALIIAFSCSTQSVLISIEKKELERLNVLEKKLVNNDLTVNSSTAQTLYQKSLMFLNDFPKSKNKEQVLVLAAKSTDCLNLNKKNIELIDQLLAQFPNSINAPNYLYNKGKIYEEKLDNINQAKIVYNLLVKEYPQSELAKDISQYLRFLNQSKKGQLDHLNRQ